MYITPGLSAGQHSISANYSGDAYDLDGTSVATAITISPVPVNLAVVITDTSIPYRASAYMTVTVSYNAGPPQGSITHTLDGGTPVSVTLSGGNAIVKIADTAVGSHEVAVAYT